MITRANGGANVARKSLIGDNPCRRCDDLMRWNRAGKLDALLAA